MMSAEARRLALVFAAYMALTFVMAYPFSAAPGTQVLADNPDTHNYIWTLAWDAHAFVTQPLHLFDANIYHPYANTLAYSENLIGSALIAAPVIWLTGNLVLATNLVALLTCVLCGVGAYVLARRWRLSPGAAFLCGVIFAFAPPRFFRMGQLHMTAVQWIPFTLAFLHSYFDRGRRRDLLLALGCFTLQVLSSGHGAAFLAVAIAVLIVWRTAAGEPFAITTWLKDCGATGAYLLAPAAWVMAPYWIAQNEAGLRREYPADAMPGWKEFLASPSRLHAAIQDMMGRTVNDEAIAYLFPGILALLLATIALARWRPRRGQLAADATGYFLLLGLVSAAMFTTVPVDTWRHIYWLPGFNFIRVPSRFILMVVLSLGMLAAVAFDAMTAQLPRGRRLAAATMIAVALLAEYSGYPFTGVPYAVEITDTDRWFNTQPASVVLAELPIPSVGDLGAYERHQTTAMLHTTAHWRHTLHGYSGIRRPLHEMLYEQLTAFPSPQSVALLLEMGVTHVLVHTDRYPGERWREVEAQLDRTAALRLARRDGPARVYTFVRR
jgi:hypothetical protein